MMIQLIAGFARNRCHEDVAGGDDHDAAHLPADLEQERAARSTGVRARRELLAVDADCALLHLARRVAARFGKPAFEQQVLDWRADEHRTLGEIGRHPTLRIGARSRRLRPSAAAES